jgi:hypothetical protein
MSWDALIAKVAGDNFEKPAENAKLVSMGSVREMRSVISEYFPSIKWQENGQGFVTTDSGSLEFLLIGRRDTGANFNAIQDSEAVESIGVSARGGGDPVGIVTQFAILNKWSVADSQEGTWMDLRNVSRKSWKEFTTYRDKIANSAGSSGSSETGSIGINLVISIALFALIAVAIKFLPKNHN